MKKSAHFKSNTAGTIISLVIMLAVAAAVIFGSRAIYDYANKKYNEPVQIDFTVASTKDIDISSTDAQEYNVTAAKEAYDESGALVAYIIDGTTVGYNQESPIEMSSVISADGAILCSIDIVSQEETEYLGVRIAQDDFKNQFEGRYLPVVASTSTEKGSKIDLISKSTISSQAVIDGVKNAQSFVEENFLKDAE